MSLRNGRGDVVGGESTGLSERTRSRARAATSVRGQTAPGANPDGAALGARTDAPPAPGRADQDCAPWLALVTSVGREHGVQRP
jgi:hypothetical protein